MSKRHCVLVALDSIGIDPLGVDRQGSVYRDSRFLFPRVSVPVEPDLPVQPVQHRSRRGVLVQTDVTGGLETGAIECAITYTSIFTGRDTLAQHGLMSGLGLKERLLESLVEESNLFRCFSSPCLANAIFPLHLAFLGDSYAMDLLPAVSRSSVEASVTLAGQPLRLLGDQRHGLAELFTIAEINQNIFVHAARRAGVRLRTWQDVREDDALTGSLTHELENGFDLSPLGIEPLPPRSVAAAAEVLVHLSAQHDFVFYKYQMADLVSHSGRHDSARAIFATIEEFLDELLQRSSPETTILVTSDHGHLEQIGFSKGHPKSMVPTWYFGPDAEQVADALRQPQGIFEVVQH